MAMMVEMMHDIDCATLCEDLAPLAPHPEAVQRLDRWGTKSYKSQKAHVITWLSSQGTTGSGAYTRKSGNTSGRTCYNRLLNPGMLIWIASALGADDKDVKAATMAAVEAERINYRGRCNAFRALIPFDMILELIQRPDGWQLDPALADLCELDEGRIYSPRPDSVAEFDRIFFQEMGL